MKTTHISHEHLEALALGFAIFGSGGGSNPEFGKRLAKGILSIHGPAPLISVEDLPDDALVVPVSFMGAPLIQNVTKPNGQEFLQLLQYIEQYFGRKPTALIAAEIGGSNGFSPFLCASILGIPIVDGDTIGRAFPELTMATTTLYNVSPIPAFLASAQGNIIITVNKLHETNSLEQLSRQLAVSFGSKAAIISDIMTGAQAKNVCIRGSLSKALHLGTLIIQARRQNIDPLAALVLEGRMHIICFGIISAISRELKYGFVVGHFTLQTETTLPITVYFKNENLIVYEGEQPLVSTPDIIIPLSQDDAQPLTVELLEIGKKVSLMCLPSDPIWLTTPGLSLVGPRAFGYDTDYVSYKAKL